jgi:chemotaxis regulatin CheY-phosphate phosphatase CheZ
MDQSEIDAILNNMNDADEQQTDEKENNISADNENSVAGDNGENTAENTDKPKDKEETDLASEESDLESKNDEVSLDDNDRDNIQTDIITSPPDFSETTLPLDDEGATISLDDIKHKIIGTLTSLTDLKELLVDLDILNKISKLSEALAKGELSQGVDIKVKGALGNLVENLRQTMLKLQQLDSSVKKESSKVPALAEQLDAITKDTEKATQTMLTKIDEVLAKSDSATAGLGNIENTLKELIEEKEENNSMVSALVKMLEDGVSDEQLAGAALEYIVYLKETDSHNKDLNLLLEMQKSVEEVKESQTVLQNDAFDIMNELQFQDITRQKIEKVIQLLKDLQLGLKHLLEIFHMDVDEDFEIIDDEKIADTTQNNIFSVKTEADYKKADVDDIINNFKQNNDS